MEAAVQSAEAGQGETSSWDPTQGPPVGASPEVVEWYNNAQRGFQQKAEGLNAKYQWASPYEERLKEQDPEAIGAWLDWYQQLQTDPQGASEAFYSLGTQLGYLEGGGEEDEDYEESEGPSQYEQQLQALTQEVHGLKSAREDEALEAELEDAFDALEERVGELPEGMEGLLVDRASRLASENPNIDIAELVNQSYDALQKDITAFMGQDANKRASQPFPAETGGSEPNVENAITPENRDDFIRSRLREHFG